VARENVYKCKVTPPMTIEPAGAHTHY